jgi:ribosomal-protein-alanine N-acetyltransferase
MAEPAVRMSVRLPQPGDVRSLEDTEELCFKDPWPGHLFASELFAPGRFHRVCVNPSGKLVAYLFSAWQYLDLHVLKVATLPEYQRCGLARRLMAMAESHAAEMCGDAITLEVRTDNAAAIALYRELGYSHVGHCHQYYADGEDAIVMTKDVRTLEAPERLSSDFQL